MIPHGDGFLVTLGQTAQLDAGALLKPYRNGRDLTDRSRGLLVIDTFGLSENELRSKYPQSWQWLHDKVKPHRDQNPRKTRRENWWLFGENQPRMRSSTAGLPRYIVTVMTAKHRVFQFIDGSVLPDQMLVCMALADAYHLGVLSSRIHSAWALAAGSRLGVGNDPRYNKTLCFDAFPFPAASPEQQARIAALAEELDSHRKRQQAAHPELTLTGMYNVLAKIRAGEALTAKDKTIHEQGLVAVLRQIHDELDAAVLAAYGWQDIVPGDSDALLDRLVALNLERAAEEAAGHIRWLRPEFQNPSAAVDPQKQAKMDLPQEPASTATTSATPAAKRPWPTTLPEQVRAVADQLSTHPLDETALAARFAGKGPWKKRLPEILAMLAALGRAKQSGGGWVG